MKKFFVTSVLLSLGMLFAQPLTAQIKVRSNGQIKMGALSSSTSTAYDLEMGFAKIRLNLSNSSTAMAGVDKNIYIYHESQSLPPIINGVTTKSIVQYANIIAASSLQIGTQQHPATLYCKQPIVINSSGVSALSDRRYKDNIRAMEGGLSEVLRLQPVRFDYKRLNEDETFWDSLARLNKVGFIAQDVKSIIPEAVNHDFFGDFYSLNQTDFIPYIVGSIQELNAIIQEQNETIQDLTARITYLEAANADPSTPDATFNSLRPKGEPTETVKSAEGNRLWSNVPNPFKQETHIHYALTDDVREAQLCIYDLSGKQLACHRLTDRGESEFTLRAASLMPGIYLYSLIADGNVIDTHRMVVTE